MLVASIPSAGISWPNMDEVFMNADQHKDDVSPKKVEMQDALNIDSLLNSVSGLYCLV